MQLKIKTKHRLQAFPQKCRYCQACTMACSMIHENGSSSLSKARLTVERAITDNMVTISICRHCDNPKCMSDCPTGAMSRDQEGIVLIDEKKCSGCGNCQKDCPFDAIVYIQERGVFQKCDLCYGRADGPICVEICPVNALALKSGDR